MRKLMGHDNVKFFCSACRILKAGTNTAGHECLNKLLLEGDVLLASLADPMLFSLGSAIDLARVFARDRGGTATAYAHPAMLLKLMRAPDQRLRSKTIILFCHARRNRQWTERQMSDEESRIRANAVEGPWGVNSPAARAVMKEAWQDVDHRVAANAMKSTTKTLTRDIEVE